MRKKLYIQTYGCQMNEYDSSRIADLLGETHEMELVDSAEQADVLLVNTCSIREKAQEKLFHLLGRWNKLKEKNPNLTIGVGGCVASQEGKAIRKRAPQVDIIFGPQTLHKVPKMLESNKAEKIPVVDITFPAIEKFDFLPEPKVDGVTAFVSIMEGCDKYCSYCIVPYTRGAEISRPLDDVIAECYNLAAKGVREVNLLGQNVNAYRGVKHDKTQADLAELIYLVSKIDGISRIRFTTSHPLEFSDSLIEAYTKVPELVSHLHLPVQSGSNSILAAMKRNHTAEHYLERIEKIRQARPNIKFSSDFIVGFPGETDEDFTDTMNLIAKVGFDTSFSFIFSKRPGTPAVTMPDSTSEATKKQRLQLLQQRLAMQASQISRRMLGSTQNILVTGYSKKDPGQLSGRTECNRIVNFSSLNAELIGNFAMVEIQEALPNSLRGKLVSANIAS
jgi:tRNA-2-methylthio-N6-dimethylallyladenosine synthase